MVDTNGEDRSDAASTRPCRHTVVALFEDTIDAEQALSALRKSHHPAEQISLLIRDRAGEEQTGEDTTAVARALVATALEAVGSWLVGLASLIVPERGTYLAAGPIGAALAGISANDHQNHAGTTARTVEELDTPVLGADALLHTVTEFGFAPDEASYLEHRLAAGSTLVAVTTDRTAELRSTREVFADHNAVHIGMAQTDQQLATEVDALLAAPPEVSSGGDVVVTDAVAPLQRVCHDPANGSPLRGFCGRLVVDGQQQEVGQIAELLTDSASGSGDQADQQPAVRYLIIGFGGVLGLGRHHATVPATLSDLRTEPVRLTVNKDLLHDAPAYDPHAPFSRREERAICMHFGMTPYWEESR